MATAHFLFLRIYLQEIVMHNRISSNLLITVIMPTGDNCIYEFPIRKLSQWISLDMNYLHNFLGRSEIYERVCTFTNRILFVKCRFTFQKSIVMYPSPSTVLQGEKTTHRIRRIAEASMQQTRVVDWTFKCKFLGIFLSHCNRNCHCELFSYSWVIRFPPRWFNN